MKKNEESTDNALDDLLSKGFNIWTEEPEKVQFENPVLNGMFNGGIPRKSVIQIAAQSGVGKSTLALQISKELCEKGENVLYIDAEKGLNMNMMNSIGIAKFLNNNNKTIGGRFIIAQECDCTEVNNLINTAANSKAFNFIFLDSLGSLDSGIYDLGGTDANNPKVGADTKSLKIIMKTMNKVSMTSNIGFVFINHLAQSIGSYIPTENPTGGRAPLYLSDIIFKLTKKSSEFEKSNLGQKVEFEAIKSRQGAGKTKVPFYIRFGKGIAMIPTYREVLEEVTAPYLDNPNHPVLEIRGGGNGSLFIKDEEFKFRGDKQLMTLIAQNYRYIKSIVPWKMWEVQSATSDIYDLEYDEDTSSPTEVPEEFSDLEIVATAKDRVYFDKGVDSTGQEYSIYYDLKKDRLTLDFNTTQGEDTNNPTKADYKQLKKKLDKYLKSLN